MHWSLKRCHVQKDLRTKSMKLKGLSYLLSTADTVDSHQFILEIKTNIEIKNFIVLESLYKAEKIILE